MGFLCLALDASAQVPIHLRMASETRSIAVCAPVGIRPALQKLIVGCGWGVIDVGLSQPDIVRAVRDRADGYVLYNEDAPFELLSALRMRPSERPLVAIAGAPCLEAAPDGWLPRLNGPL